MPTFKSSRNVIWNYDLQGEGDAILFLHGFGVSHRLWIQQIKYFVPDFTTIAPDFPGHGKSSFEPLDINELTLDINELLNHLDIVKVTVIASSFGGLIALRMCKVCPDKLQRLVFVGSMPRFSATDQYPAGLNIPKIRKLGGQFDQDLSTVLDMFFRSLFTMKERQSERYKWMKEFRRSDDLPVKEALHHYLDLLEKEDLRDLIVDINCSVQFINGDEDYICPLPMVDWLKREFPFARFDILQGCGHFPFISKPKEFNRIVERFI